MKRLFPVLVACLVACSAEVLYAGWFSRSVTGPAETNGLPPVVTFTALPVPLQVYPRDVKSNRAGVEIAGSVATPGYKSIVVRVKKDDEAKLQVHKQKLKYKDGAADFALCAEIAAELKNHEFAVSLLKGKTERAVTNVTGVVAGDIILINGQSNAEARGFSGSANGNQHPFLRSFGVRVHNQTAANNLNWRMAEGDRADGPGAVGQWGLRLGRQIVDTYRVPVAIVNGAIGGRAIDHYQPHADNRGDLGTNYGRLLFRCTQAGVQDAVRAILWYQGESDNGNADVHEQGFIALYKAWKEDFPTLEKVYILQLRPGCGVDRWNVELRNRQRLLPDAYPDMTVMSTTGINEHDGCHYAYVGYEKIGDRMFGLLARDLYGEKASVGVDAPNIAGAAFSNPERTEITLTTRNEADELRFTPGAEADFKLEGCDGITITGGDISGNRIILKLSGDGGTATGINYAGHAGAGPWVINRKGIGLLAFRAGL